MTPLQWSDKAMELLNKLAEENPALLGDLHPEVLALREEWSAMQRDPSPTHLEIM